jgi:spore germination protein KB
VIIFLVSRSIHLSHLKPVLENGLLPVLQAGAVAGGFRGELAIVFMLFPYLNKQQEGLKTTLLALALLTFAATFTFVPTGLFGAAVIAHLVFSWYDIARFVSLAHFVERVEILIAFIWALGVFVKLSLYLHVSSIAVASTFGLKNYRLAVVPIAVIVLILSQTLFATYMQITRQVFNPLYVIPFELVIPALVLLIAVLRKKRGRERGDQQNAQIV